LVRTITSSSTPSARLRYASCANMRPTTVRASSGTPDAKTAGAPIKPTPSITPAHSPATQAMKRVERAEPAASDVTDLDDLVALDPRRRLHIGHIARFLADQRPRDRRADRDQPMFQVGFVVADDLV